MEQPVGTVTLLFTDIEGSTRLLEHLGAQRYREALDLHQDLVREVVGRFDGYEVDTEGDAFFVAFGRARDGAAAAAEIQRALARAEWPDGLSLRVRMGIHTGEPLAAPPRYVGVDVHRAARIASAAHGGQVVISQVTADLLAVEPIEGLRLRDLGLHRLKDLSEPRTLFQLAGEGLEERFPPLRTLEGRRTNLPIEVTSFVGRERELAEVGSLLTQPQSRLLTLTGPGGTGKTRLALQAAGSVVEEFEDGVFVVFLAATREPDAVLSAVAQAVGLREQMGEALAETLASFLRDRELLLVLDNFEQIVEVAPVLAGWMAASPKLRLLVTSRAALHLSGEQIYDVHPLRLPEDAGGEAVPLADSEAALLFLARARAARPDFVITDENAAAVAEICARLDGLPLALELAAARVRVLPPQALLARLDQRLSLLTGGARDLDERQRTMRATIAWSYELLDPEEQALFARLSVFVGGFRIDAVEAIVAAGAEPVDLLDGLSSLVEKSLLVEHSDGKREPRFFMLETIREYARERLEQSGEAAALDEAHARRFLALADEAATHWEGWEREKWMALLAPDQANFDAALHSLIETDSEAAAQLAGDLSEYWENRGQWAEGREWLSAALARHDYAAALRARLLLADAQLAIRQARYDEAADRAQRADLLLEPGDTLTLALTRHMQAWLFYYADETAEAIASAKEALDLFPEETHLRKILDLRTLLSIIERDHGEYEVARNGMESILLTAREHADQEILKETLNQLGDIYRLLGNYERAHEVVTEAVELNRAAGSRNHLAHTLTNLAKIERERGYNARAKSLADEAIEIMRSIGARHGLAMALFQRALTAFADGDSNQSRLDTQETLRICQDVGDRQGIVSTIEHLASMAVAEHEPRTAALLVGAATAIREAIDFSRSPWSEAKIADIQNEVGAELSTSAVRDLEAEGGKIPTEQAIEMALKLGTAQAVGPDEAGPSSQPAAS